MRRGDAAIMLFTGRGISRANGRPNRPMIEASRNSPGRGTIAATHQRSTRSGSGRR